MIVGRKRARDIIEKAISYASADEVRIELSGGRSGHTRFALNSITTSGDEDTLDIVATVSFGKRKGTATGTEIDGDSLRRVVKAAEEIARYSPEDPEYVPELGPQKYLKIDPYFKSTAKATPEQRATAALSSIEPAVERGLDAAGFFQHRHGFTAVGNSKRLFGYYQSTNAGYTLTARTVEGGGSGWARDGSRKIEEVDYRSVSERAIEKALRSKDAKTLEPGVYPVILEPEATANLLQFAAFTMDARQADEGRSFFARAGGGNKIGEKIVGENITLRSDPTHPSLLGRPFADDGFPAKKTTWIEKGVLKQLAYNRYWAEKQGKEPTGSPSSFILEGGASTLDDLIRETDRAVLVTRLWYIRFVDPQTILLTGLTRDGTFWVENGEIQHAVKNFRFNESPIAVLGKVTAMTKPVRVGGSLSPAIRASEFTFSSLSDAV